MFKIGDKFKLGQLTIKVTGFNGTDYRVFVSGGHTSYHDWYSADNLKRLEKKEMTNA